MDCAVYLVLILIHLFIRSPNTASARCRAPLDPEGTEMRKGIPALEGKAWMHSSELGREQRCVW